MNIHFNNYFFYFLSIKLKYHERNDRNKIIFTTCERILGKCVKTCAAPQNHRLHNFHISYLSHDFLIAKAAVVVGNICQ